MGIITELNHFFLGRFSHNEPEKDGSPGHPEEGKRTNLHKTRLDPERKAWVKGGKPNVKKKSHAAHKARVQGPPKPRHPAREGGGWGQAGGNGHGQAGPRPGRNGQQTPRGGRPNPRNQFQGGNNARGQRKNNNQKGPAQPLTRGQPIFPGGLGTGAPKPPPIGKGVESPDVAAAQTSPRPFKPMPKPPNPQPPRAPGPAASTSSTKQGLKSPPAVSNQTPPRSRHVSSKPKGPQTDPESESSEGSDDDADDDDKHDSSCSSCGGESSDEYEDSNDEDEDEDEDDEEDEDEDETDDDDSDNDDDHRHTKTASRPRKSIYSGGHDSECSSCHGERSSDEEEEEPAKQAKGKKPAR